MGERVFGGSGGAVGAMQGSRNIVEFHARWALACRHLGKQRPTCAVCRPLVAHGELFGVVHVVSARPFAQALLDSTAVVGDQLAITLANLRLQEMLRSQSIRDPLTGLFNRRYLEETLEREIRRAARTNQSLSVVLLDVDHFKGFNDAFGHEAGDLVLREIGSVLRTRTRGSDVAGGGGRVPPARGERRRAPARG